MSLEISMYTHETITIKPYKHTQYPLSTFPPAPFFIIFTIFMYMCGKST